MKYQSGSAFRQALEQRLLARSRKEGIALARLRKTVAFDRFLARLLQDQPDAWVLKGGMALQLRLGPLARTTKDLDILLGAPLVDVHQWLVRAALLDLKDWFQFAVGRPARVIHTHQPGGQRFTATALLDGRPFEQFHVDVGIGDPIVAPVDYFASEPLLAFAEIAPTVIPCYPVTQHLAEKLHAYTRPHASGASTRVKDLIDMLLLAQTHRFSAAILRQAIDATFSFYNTHALPARFPPPPRTWATPFRRLAKEVGLNHPTLKEGAAAAQRFLDPVLGGDPTIADWDPDHRRWDIQT